MEINIGNIRIELDSFILGLGLLVIMVMSICFTIAHCQDTWSQERITLIEKGVITEEYMTPKEFIVKEKIRNE